MAKSAKSAAESHADAVPTAEANGEARGKKTVCPVTREQFAEEARPLMANVGGTPIGVPVKEFSTGSLGWYQQGKITIDLGGVPVVCQCAISLQIVGSKELAS